MPFLVPSQQSVIASKVHTRTPERVKMDTSAVFRSSPAMQKRLLSVRLGVKTLGVQMMFLREEISYRYKHPSFYGENEVRISCWAPWQHEETENLFSVNEMIEEIIISPLVENYSDIEKQIKDIIGDLKIKISRSQCPLCNRNHRR